MRQEIFAVVLVLLVVGSLGAGYFAGSQVPVKTTTDTSTITSIATATSTVTSATTTTQTMVTTDLEGTSCRAAINPAATTYPTNFNSNGSITVLHLSVPTTALICIEYSFDAPLNYTFILGLIPTAEGGNCSLSHVLGLTPRALRHRLTSPIRAI